MDALEPFDVLGIHIAVGHLYANLFQALLAGIDIGVALGLGKMYRNRFF